MTIRWYQNSAAPPLSEEAVAAGDPLAFHRSLPGYAPTPLRAALALAAHLGVGRLWVKDEAERLGMPSFKILGASWAVYRALIERLGAEPKWDTLAAFAAQIAPLLPLQLAAATDGNHGRAVARMARLLGCTARIFVPAGTAEARIAAIAGEGAEVIVVAGSYDDAVARSAAEAGPHCLVISDTSWPGYVDVPRWMIDGYSTLFAEIDADLARHGEAPPDVVLVQMGVGALAAAAIGHYQRAHPAGPHPLIIGVEPTRAACVINSLEAGAFTAAPAPHDSIMAGPALANRLAAAPHGPGCSARDRRSLRMPWRAPTRRSRDHRRRNRRGGPGRPARPGRTARPRPAGRAHPDQPRIDHFHSLRRRSPPPPP
jgi:diaminopropionate ammonia-lyase